MTSRLSLRKTASSMLLHNKHADEGQSIFTKREILNKEDIDGRIAVEWNSINRHKDDLISKKEFLGLNPAPIYRLLWDKNPLNEKIDKVKANKRTAFINKIIAFFEMSYAFSNKDKGIFIAELIDKYNIIE